MTEREKYVAELRCLADFYAMASDELPRPTVNREVFFLAVTAIPEILKNCGRVEKSASGGYVELTKTLVYGKVVFNFSQDKVCERKVIGQTWVETRPVVEGHFTDQVEWECKPILRSIADRKETE